LDEYAPGTDHFPVRKPATIKLTHYLGGGPLPFKLGFEGRGWLEA
jgi:hypothetical protein